MSDYFRDSNFNRAQARYDAMEPEYADEPRDAEQCGHCENGACGEWSEDSEDEDGFQAGTFRYAEECAACNRGLCKRCMDDVDLPCPALGRIAYPFEREGTTLREWRAGHVTAWNRYAARGWCSREHADAMIADVMENYGPKESNG